MRDAIDGVGLVGEGGAEQIARLGEAAAVDVGDELEEPPEPDHSARLHCVHGLAGGGCGSGKARTSPV